MSMWKECEGLQEELVKMRRELHQIPEFGLDLPETQKYVTDKLDELGIPYKCSGTDSSIIAEIKGGQPGKTVALRADMDALKITEANDVDYKSKHEGLMHACGHDNHIAMLLGAAKVLNAHKAEIKGNVRLLFQTAEELSKGAEIMIKDGAMDGVDAVFGQHIGSIINKDIPAGKVIITPGCCMASFDRFVIHVKGTGCHGSTPEKGTDPITMASHIVINLQEIIAREVSAVKAAVVTIGYFHGGVAYNAIPSEVEIEGTIRALEEPMRQYLAKRIEEIAKSTAATFRGTAEVEMDWGAPPVINNDEMAALVTEAAKEVVGEEDVVSKVPAPNMAGEDFDADVYIDAISNEAVAVFSKKKIETRIGGASKTISFKDEKLFAFIQNIVKQFKFYGPVDMDFFYQDGEYYLSEINPRFGGAYLHAFGAGVDFPKMILNNMKGITNDPIIGDYDEGVLMLMYDEVVITTLDQLRGDYND